MTSAIDVAKGLAHYSSEKMCLALFRNAVAAVLLALNTACGYTTLEIPYAVAQPDSSSSEESYEDAIAASFGIPPLRSVNLPAGYRELRIWVASYQLLRIIADEHRVVGELGYWWIEGINDDKSGKDVAYAKIKNSCQKHLTGPVINGQTFKACRVEFKVEPKWRDVLELLTSFEVWTLPSQRLSPVGIDDIFPGPPVDITEIQVNLFYVEARQGSTYRTYSYWNPESGGPADKIFQLVKQLRDFSRSN